jgi:hypothetical protein
LFVVEHRPRVSLWSCVWWGASDALCVRWLAVELRWSCSAWTHEHLLGSWATLRSRLLLASSCEASEHDVSLSKHSLWASSSWELGWISCVVALSNWVWSQRVAGHVSLWPTARSNRSLTLSWAFPSSQTCSYLSLLLLVLLLLSQLVVVHFSEWAHRSLALLLVLICVRAEHSIHVLWSSTRTGSWWSTGHAHTSTSINLRRARLLLRFTLLHSILQLLTASLILNMLLVRACHSSTCWVL